MKCIIIYFSLTDNTEKIAQSIQAGVKQTAGHCDIVKIKDANPRRLSDYDLIGLGSPVFEVTNVWDFIKNMRFVGGKHIFAFCTHGTMPDRFFPTMIPKLKDRGLIVIGMRDWYGDDAFGIRPYYTTGHPDEIDLREAEEFGREMVERSWKISAGETEHIPPVPPMPPQPSMPVPDAPAGAASMVKFHKEKCLYPGCRLCMDNCPVDGIDLSVKPPVITQPCMSCQWCARICPTGALDIHDWLDAMKPLGEGESNMKSVILQCLKKAEAEGHFRRLVPTEKVGTESPPDRNKHPQWIIGKGLQ